MTRSSLELGSDFCRLVVVDVSGIPALPSSHDVRVRAFVGRLPQHPESAGFVEALQHLRREHDCPREAVVTIWGLRAIHQHARVESLDDANIESSAIAAAKEEIALLEADGSRANIAIAAGDAWGDDAGQWRDVSLTAVSAPEMANRIAPLTSAGFDVVRVLTPAMALASLARSRRDAPRGIASMYVVVVPHAVAMAIVRDGLLLVARELPFGHTSGDAEGELPFDVRLAAELRRSQMYFRHMCRATLDTIVMCGDVDHLRVLAAAIGTALHVPVETLDALTGIDDHAVPDPAGEFRDGVAALRLAISAGADPALFPSLLPLKTASSARRAARALPLAGVAAAAAIVAIALWFAFSRPVTTPAPRRESVSRAQTRQPPSTEAPAVLNQSTATPSSKATTPVEEELPPSSAVESPQRPSVPPRDVVVGSILYSPDRRLAIINGRIAGVGDDVGGLRVVAIERRVVVVESADGAQHRIGLGPATRVRRE